MREVLLTSSWSLPWEEFSVVYPYEFSWGGCLDYLILFNDGAKSHYDLFNIRYAIIPRSFTYPRYYNHVSTS